MSCQLGNQKPDWNAFALGELDARTRRDAEVHAAGCADCQDELAALRVTLDALATLREEEVPRRIAFVSDKVFEPTWWDRIRQAVLRPSFAGAAVIAAAILGHAVLRPASPPARPEVDVAGIEARMNQEIDRRVEARLASAVEASVSIAVKQAVAETETRANQRAAQMLAATERRYADTTDFLSRQVTQMYALNTGLGVR